MFLKPGALVHFLLGDKSVKTEILDAVESKSLKKDKPHFEIGDIVDVHCRIKEGDKERTQVFTGTVVLDVRAIRSGKTRRAKLYYLRKRAGKAVRLAQRHSDHTVSK